MAPTSRPRVGEAATSTLGSDDSSRASSTFWTLPPESSRVGVVGPGVRMSNRSIRSTARSRMRGRRRNGPEESGADA